MHRQRSASPSRRSTGDDLRSSAATHRWSQRSRKKLPPARPPRCAQATARAAARARNPARCASRARVWRRRCPRPAHKDERRSCLRGPSPCPAPAAAWARRRCPPTPYCSRLQREPRRPCPPVLQRAQRRQTATGLPEDPDCAAWPSILRELRGRLRRGSAGDDTHGLRSTQPASDRCACLRARLPS